MKRFLFHITLIYAILCSSCYSQKNTSIKQIEYFASTRGSSVHIIVNPNKVIYNSNTYKISNKKWNSIASMSSKLNLINLKNLKSPTNERHRDAALVAEIKITTSENLFISSQFDHGNPPEEITKLVEKILKLVDM